MGEIFREEIEYREPNKTRMDRERQAYEEAERNGGHGFENKD